MYVDIGALVDMLSFLVASLVFLFVAVRGIQMTKAFVSRVYRNRALWIVGVSLFVVVDDVVSHAPFVDDFTVGVVPLGFVFVFLVVAVIFAFIDSTVMVALEMDFFHRDALGWRRGRYVGYAAVLGEVGFALLVIILASQPTTPGWVSAIVNSSVVPVQFLVVFGIACGYGGASLVIGARRTPDTTLRKHMALLGLVLVLGVTSIANDFTVSFTLLDDVLALSVSYVWYRAAMSLSPVGRVERGFEVSSQDGKAKGALGKASSVPFLTAQAPEP
jgi:hypothetical protein